MGSVSGRPKHFLTYIIFKISQFIIYKPSNIIYFSYPTYGIYNYEFLLSLCKIVRSSVILLLPLFTISNLKTSLKPTLLKRTNDHVSAKPPTPIPAVTITVFKYRNKIGKIVVKAVPYSVK
jgi:hypothetical protein